jgi:Flp pilus assembly protein TadD
VSQVARRYYERGVKALDNGDLESAIEALRAAVDLAAGFGNARVAYAIALARFGDAPRGAQVLRAGIGRASSKISAAAMWATLGDVLTLGGDFFGAEEAFREASATPGFQARAASGLARVYAKLGRHKDMAAQLKIAAAASAAQ